jgi:cytochrome c-type biogenesis protein CcmF
MLIGVICIRIPAMVTLGQIILALPLAFAAVQCIKLIGERNQAAEGGGLRLGISHSQLAKLTFLGVVISFLFLVYKFIISDFSYALVFQHSHSMKPLMYKISGVWGNHEGSMMLFLVILCGYSFAFARLSKFQFKEQVLGYQGMLAFLLIFYIFFTSNPFDPIAAEVAPQQGMGLNPLLQDIGLALHPPLLYFGFAGFSLAFSIALVVLKNNITEKGWCEFSRPWILFAWIF